MGVVSLEERTIHRRVSSSTLDVVLAEMDPGHTHHRSTCPDGQFWLSVSGIQVVSSPRGTRRQNPFDLMYYCPQEAATRTTSDRTLAYGVRLRLSELREDERAESWVQGGALDWQTRRRVIGLIRQALLTDSDPHDLDETVMGWIGRPDSAQNESTMTRWMRQVEALLREDPTMTLTALSRQIGLAPAYLSSQYSSVCGRSVSRFRRQIMLDQALRFASDRTLNEAAVEAGFYDASHFHRVCVAELGVRPADLKQIVRPITMVHR